VSVHICVTFGVDLAAEMWRGVKCCVGCADGCAQECSDAGVCSVYRNTDFTCQSGTGTEITGSNNTACNRQLLQQRSFRKTHNLPHDAGGNILTR
jgi:hypothetical protein